MASRKRDKHQIISQILEVCMGEGASKTQIVYQVNLNFRTVNPYLDALIDGGLIEVLDGRLVLYKITTKGEDMLGKLKEVDSMMPMAEL